MDKFSRTSICIFAIIIMMKKVKGIELLYELVTYGCLAQDTSQGHSSGHFVCHTPLVW